MPGIEEKKTEGLQDPVDPVMRSGERPILLRVSHSLL
jgi:hypothetical protein